MSIGLKMRGSDLKGFLWTQGIWARSMKCQVTKHLRSKPFSFHLVERKNQRPCGGLEASPASGSLTPCKLVFSDDLTAAHSTSAVFQVVFGIVQVYKYVSISEPLHMYFFKSSCVQNSHPHDYPFSSNGPLLTSVSPPGPVLTILPH